MHTTLQPRRIGTTLVAMVLVLGAASVAPAAADHDTTPPEVSILVDPADPDGRDGWYVHSPLLTIDAVDVDSNIAFCEYFLADDHGQSGWTLYEGPFRLGDSANLVSARCTDTEGNVSDPGQPVTTRIVLVDTIKPTAELVASPGSPDGANDWYVTSPTITIQGTDHGSGLDRCEYRLDGGPWIDFREPFQLADGSREILVRCTDVAGHPSLEMGASFDIDTTAPSVGVTTSPTEPDGLNGWYVTQPTVTFETSDDDSGIEICSLSVNGNHALTFLGSPAHFIPHEGERLLSTHCSDNAGNVSQEVGALARYDATAPAIEFTGNEGTYAVDDVVTIACIASDQTSGIAQDTCDDASVQSVPAHELVGTTVLEATATDVAGHAHSASTSFTVIVDDEGVKALIDEFVDDPEVADSFKEKVDGIVSAPNDQARGGKCQSLTNQITGKQGDDLTDEEASTLLELLDHLC